MGLGALDGVGYTGPLGALDGIYPDFQKPGGNLDLDNLAGLPAHQGTADRGVAGHFAGFQIHLVMADNGVAHLHPARKIGECHPAKQ